RAEFVGAALVHPDFFRVFGLAPVVGRSFTMEDAEQSAIVNAGFALRNYGSAAGALGQSVFIDSRSYRIVGVMQASMQFPERIEVWAALSREPSNRNRTGHNYRTVAKLAPDVSVQLANARLAQVAARLAAAFPVSNHDKTFTVIPLRDSLASRV